MDKHCELCKNAHPECLCLTCSNDVYGALDPEEPCCCVMFQTVKRHCPVTECRKYKEERKTA